MKDILDDDDLLIGGGDTPKPNKGQRQKDYRKSMKDKGLICKQFWVPENDVGDVEQYVAELRTAHLNNNNDYDLI